MNIIKTLDKMILKFSFSLLILCTSSIQINAQTNVTFNPKGYTSLFNGTDLSEWVIPENDNGHWRVIDGVIDYDALSEALGDKSLYSKRKYHNYTLHIEWKFKSFSGDYPIPTILPNGDYAQDQNGNIITFMAPNADSGVLMRGTDQVQIWCWKVGSGEIWSTRTNLELSEEERMKAVPIFHADNPVGQWNSFDITLINDRVTVYLNNILVVEDALMPDLPEYGPIGLQHHGGKNMETGEYDGASSLVQFRNIWIKEIE